MSERKQAPKECGLCGGYEYVNVPVAVDGRGRAVKRYVLCECASEVTIKDRERFCGQLNNALSHAVNYGQTH